jgi:DNA modification methylase
MENGEQLTFEFEQRPTIKGFPELRWTGKRPYRSTQYYPAQLRETYGTEQNSWINKIFWGDNLQVMSHLLKKYRGQIDLIYIDPPFDSRVEYKKKVEIKGIGKTETDSSTFEEKQYGDIWTNDEYLQFMYERLIIMRELLSEKGCIYLHCDWHKGHYLKILMDELFGADNFINEITWYYYNKMAPKSACFPRTTDKILLYAKGSGYIFNTQYEKRDKPVKQLVRKFVDGKAINARDEDGNVMYKMSYEKRIDDVWKVSMLQPADKVEPVGYPTQKPEKLLERIILASSNPGDLVLDCFMGSGTTQAVAMKLGRRFNGADINLGAIQTTTKRLLSVAKDLEDGQTSMEAASDIKYTGFEVYNVNNYDFFRNPVEARDLLISALEIQPFPQSDVWDGELDGRMVKIMPVNRIATKADLKELLANLPYKTYEKRKEENPNQPVERMTIVCMGHEPDLKGALEQELIEYKVDIQIVDILRDKKDLQLKRDSEAEIVREGDKLIIRSFYPMNLLQKLSLQKEYVEDWRQLVDSIMIDWNYDGVVMQPVVTDVPGKNEMVSGIYDIPENAGTIKVKITDLLSESLEVEVR